jgi:hypothetical protein
MAIRLASPDLFFRMSSRVATASRKRGAGARGGRSGPVPDLRVCRPTGLALVRGALAFPIFLTSRCPARVASSQLYGRVVLIWRNGEIVSIIPSVHNHAP